jgi:hypothetical protein
MGCNVCKSPTICQSSFVAVGGNTTSGVTSEQTGLNDTLTCSSTPQVFAAGEMSCAVLVGISDLRAELLDANLV